MSTGEDPPGAALPGGDSEWILEDQTEEIASGQKEEKEEMEEGRKKGGKDMEEKKEEEEEGEEEAMELEEIEEIREGEEKEDKENKKVAGEEEEILVMEEEEKGGIFDDDFFREEQDEIEQMEKYFDPESSIHHSRLSAETRLAIARYAAAIFDWFACLPKVELLDDLPIDKEYNPFPVTPGCKRILLRRDLGIRLADVWRQTKSMERVMNHFKLTEGVALMSLLDYGMNNASMELDVVPMLKPHGISRDDFYTTALYLTRYSAPSDWRAPDDFITEQLLPPMALSVLLYLVHKECSKGVMCAVPWHSFHVDSRQFSREELEKMEAVLLEAFEQLEESAEEREANKRRQNSMFQLERQIEMVKKETSAVRELLADRQRQTDEIRAKYAAICKERGIAIEGLMPENWDLTEERLKRMEEDVLFVDERQMKTQNTNLPNQMELTLESYALQVGDEVMARRESDSQMPFEEATVVSLDESDPSSAVEIRWKGEKKEGEEEEKTQKVERSDIARMRKDTRLPTRSEGLRVVAKTRHPLHPKQEKFFSGTIISKYDMSRQDYVICFDDFFDQYVHMEDVHLLCAQPLREVIREGEEKRIRMDLKLLDNLITPSKENPGSTKERKAFIHYFFLRYPYWSMIRFKEKLRTNAGVKKRDGSAWQSMVVAVDRNVVTLRFNPTQGFDTVSCSAYPCNKPSHQHYEETLYRGSVRISQERHLTFFDSFVKKYCALDVNDKKAVDEFDLLWAQPSNKGDESTAPRSHRRMRRMYNNTDTGIAEPAVPILADETVQMLIDKSKRKARKCGSGLQIERIAISETNYAVRKANHLKKKKKESELHLVHHNVKRVDYEDMQYHAVCTRDCLKSKEIDPLGPSIQRDQISYLYVPVMCGWRRIKQDYSTIREMGAVYYRAPCGKPLFCMPEILTFLDTTHSELTVDNFSFAYEVDETAYITVDSKYIKMPDFTHGQEGRPLPVINEIDDENPPDFPYRARRYPYDEQKTLETVSKEFCSGCDCTDDCRDWTKCACQRLTHRESFRAKSTYNKVSKGYTYRILPEKVGTGVYECNANCKCRVKRCFNRVVQNDIKVPLQMMKTEEMGWGMRAVVDIPQGTFISCYHGAILTDAEAELHTEGDEYFADIDFYNLAEGDKQNAGTDSMADEGMFIEDCGTRELTSEEIGEAEGEDETSRIRRKEKEEKKRMRRMDEMEEREGEEEREEREEEEEGGEGEGGGGGEEEVDEGVEEDVEDEGGEDEEGTEEEEEGEGEEEGGERSTPEGEERGKTEEEIARERHEAEVKEAKERKIAEDKKRKEEEERSQRYLIPYKNEDQRNQYEVYFENAGEQNLFIIDAKICGNLGRQYNHGCEPNMFTQHVFVDTHDIRLPWAAFFAKRDIQAGEELLWDYGWVPSHEYPRGLKCQCGAEGCRIDLL